jgi:FMN phosphatase YigB (HAD superfamily)
MTLSNGVLLSSNVCVLFDLDDTLFAEKDYFQSVFESFTQEIGLGAEIVETYLDQFSEVRTNIKDIFSHFLHNQKIYTEENRQHLFDIYRGVTTQLSPHDGVNALISELVESDVKVAVLTNGVPLAQKNKWASLKIGRKERITFHAARDLGGDKPSAVTYEAWRSAQKVEWEQVIAVGDKYDNDVAHPLHMGACGVLVQPSKQENQQNNRFRQAKDISSATEHILSFVRRV